MTFARELERDDERLARAIADVGTLAGDVEEVREDAARLRSFFDGLPLEREAAAATLAAAHEELEHRRTELERAEAELARVAERSRDEEAVAAARRAAARARDAVGMAERKVERSVDVADALERDATSARRETPEVERRARELGERLARVPRLSREAAAPPPEGLDAVAGWAARARAGLFVVRGGLESERERVVRQANELYASAVGEPSYAASVALVRKRLERGRGNPALPPEPAP